MYFFWKMEVRYFTAWAKKVGWDVSFGENITEEQRNSERKKFFVQQKNYFRLCALFEKDIPSWVQADLVFPISERWIDSIEHRVDFDRQWRIQWDRELLGIHPSYQAELPELPSFIDSDDIIILIGELKKVRRSFRNRLKVMLVFFDENFYRHRSEVFGRIQWFSKEKKWRLEREEKKKEREAEVYKRHMTSMVPQVVEVPAGDFMMGALLRDEEAQDREIPRHNVVLTHGLQVSVYPCTQLLFDAIMQPDRDIQRPWKAATRVSWCEAVLFCNRLSEREGFSPCYVLPKPFQNTDNWAEKVTWNRSANGYRLLTEAEWEYCARGGEEHLYAGSNNAKEVAVHNVEEQPLVGTKKSNAFGLYDMSGNVNEWVWDRWDSDVYHRKEGKNPVSSPDISWRCIRGGCWSQGEKELRISHRDWFRPSEANDMQGFRIARTKCETP